MALLQIAEPGQSTAPHQHRIAIGIDLGTTYSLVASVRSGQSQILVDKNGYTLTPSVVNYSEPSAVVGYAAIDRLNEAATDTITSIKRFMGRSRVDIQFKHPYLLDGNDSDMPSFITSQGNKTPVEISSDILRNLKQRAEETLAQEVESVVITVPAYFDEAQRQATRDAAQLAKLKVLRLLNEPTAAALAYGLDQQQQSTQVIFDLGGGTFDVSILKLNQGVFEVLATGGHTALGGDDIDRIIAKWITSQLSSKVESAQQIQQLLSTAKQVKQQLSSQPKVDFDFLEQQLSLDLETFNSLIQPVIDRSLAVCKRVLRDAKLKPDQIDQVVLVGGSTRIPALQHQIGDLFQTTPLCDINPDEVVALGAAILADQLIGNSNNQSLLLDVTPLSLGLETMGGLVEKIIPRNTAIPITRKQEFTTYKDGQSAMLVHVLQGERDLVSDCRSLAKFELHGIPPMTAGAARIEVSFQIDADGLLSVSARETTTDVKAEVHVKPAYGLSDQDTARLLEEGFANAEQDMAYRKWLESKVEAEREILALQQALTEDANLLNETQLIEIQQSITQVQQAIKAESDELLTEAVEQLKKRSDRFAALRMNQNIDHALRGTHLNDW